MSEEPAAVETDAQIIVLRDEHTGQLEATEQTEDKLAAARTGAAHRKAVFAYRSAGAQARAGALPRSLTAAYAAGTVNLMLEKLLQEELVPATAKEAADVAKVTHEIYKSVAGQPKDGKDYTPKERQAKADEIAALAVRLAERAGRPDAPLGGAPASPDEVPAPVEVIEAPADEALDVWDHDDDGD